MIMYLLDSPTKPPVYKNAMNVSVNCYKCDYMQNTLIEYNTVWCTYLIECLEPYQYVTRFTTCLILNLWIYNYSP